MNVTGTVLGLTVGLITLGVCVTAYALIATLLDGIRNGVWLPFIFIIVILGVPALGAIIGALVA